MITSSMSFHIFSVLHSLDSKSLFRVDNFLQENKTSCEFFRFDKTTHKALSMFSPFAAGVFVSEEVLTVLVDGVVGEVHAHVVLKEET